MQDDRQSDWSDRLGLVPLAVGVTGHRDLRPQDVDFLKSQVRSVFHTIRRTYPHTPLVLLTPLAEGADRLVAQVAEEFDVRFVIVLPLRVGDYKEDFPDSADEFEYFLNHPNAWRQVLMPQVDGQGLSPSVRRAVQYLLAGAFVARNTQILLALWDGAETGKLGGTGQIVRFKQTGQLTLDSPVESCLRAVGEPYWSYRNPIDPLESGPVYHILTPRAGSLQPGEPQAWRQLAPYDYRSEEKQREYFERIGEIYQRIDSLNQDALELLPARRAEVERNRGWLFPDVKAQQLPTRLRELLYSYASADTLALFFQGRTHKMLGAMFGLVFVAVALFGAYAHLIRPPQYLWFLAFYVTLLVLADFLYVNAKRLDYQNKYQDYRALAEGLRVQFFWRLAGLSESGSDHYLRKQKNELDWIRNALRTCSLLAEPDTRGDFESVLTHWVADQFKYFKKAAARDQGHLVRLREIGSGSLVISLLLSVFEMVRHPQSAVMIVLAVLAMLIGVVHFRFKVKDVMRRAREEAEEEIEAASLNENSASARAITGRALTSAAIRGLPYAVALALAAYELLRDHGNEALNPFVVAPGAIVLMLGVTHALSPWIMQLGGGKAGLIETLRNYLYGMNIGALMTVFLLKLPIVLPEEWRHYIKEEEHDWLVVAMGLTAVTAALLHGYAEKRALAEHHKQYKRMGAIFYRAQSRLRQLVNAGKLDEARELVRELGKEALAEHGDWVMLHRERPIELPKAEI